MSRSRDLRGYWFRTGHRTRVTQQLRPLIRGIDGTALDVGGGRDAAHDDAWGQGARRIRIDISPLHRPDVLADAAWLPVSDRSVDAIVLVEVLEHVSDPRRLLAEAARTLRPGGVVIGSVPFVFPIHGDPHDYFRYTADGLRSLLQGFDIVRVLPIGNHWSAAWTLVAARSRILRILNPLMRRLGGTPSATCPQGYVFTARTHR